MRANAKSLSGFDLRSFDVDSISVESYEQSSFRSVLQWRMNPVLLFDFSFFFCQAFRNFASKNTIRVASSASVVSYVQSSFITNNTAKMQLKILGRTFGLSSGDVVNANLRHAGS